MHAIAPSPREVAIYRRMLLDKRSEAAGGLGIRLETLARLGRTGGNRAQISLDAFVSVQMNRLDGAQLRLVEEALERIEEGDYGLCLECEEPIAAKRLRAVPWVRYCARCQGRLSRKSRAAA